MENQFSVPSTRGGKNKKYNFVDMALGEKRFFHDTTPNKLLVCAKQFCKYYNFDYKFRCWTIEGITYIMRIQ